MKVKKQQYAWLFLGVWLGLGVAYFFIFRSWAEAYFVGQAPAWFSVAAEAAYPRLATEAQRLPSSFFLDKLDSVFWRAGLLFFIVFAVSFPNSWGRKAFSTFKEQSNLFYARLYAAGTLLLVWPWWEYWQIGRDLEAFYSPSWIWLLISKNYPSESLCMILYGILILSNLIVLFLRGSKLFWFLVLSGISFFFGLSLLYSFGKIDHTYAPWSLVGFVMPWVARYPKSSWPLWLVRFSVVLPYFLAGLEKLLQSGFSWPALQGVLSFSAESHPIIAHLLPGLFVLAFLGQLLSPLALFFTSTRFFFTILGVGFHCGVYYFLDVGGIFHPWLLGYVFFLPPIYAIKMPFKRIKQCF